MMFNEFRSDSPRKTSALRIGLQITAIALFVLAIVYFMRRYSGDISNLKNLSLVDIVVIGAWSFVSYSAYAYAVYVVFIDLGLKKLGPFAWLRIYFVSRLVNFFITQGGNLYRLLLLKKTYEFSYTNTVGVTGLLIWINALIAVLLSLYVLAGLDRSAAVLALSLYQWCIILTAALLTAPFIAVLFAKAIRRSGVSRFRSITPLLDVADFFVSIFRNVRLLSILTVLSVVHYCFFVGVNYFSFQAIGQSVAVEIVCIYTTAFVFTRYINIVPGNIGVSELVGGLISEQVGTGFGNGLLVAGIVRIVEVLMILLTGLIYGNYRAFSYLKRR